MTTPLSPRPSSSSPATSSSMPSVSNMTSEHDQNDGQDHKYKIIRNEDRTRDRPTAPVANALENDDKRPHAPVAKLLHQNEQNYRQQQFQSGGDGASFPQPAAQSPHDHSSLPSPSPPTIISSPNITSPHIPAAPPTTPYTPFAAASVGNITVGGPAHSNDRFFLSEATASSLSAPNLNHHHRSYSPPLNTTTPSFHTSPPTTTTTNNNNNNDTITNLLTPPQNPFINDPHTTNLLHTTLLQTQSDEQSRIQQLLQHETSNYTTITEYRHALARERRHSLSLAIELSHYKFLSKYQSCTLHSNLEISEEARLNRIIKNVHQFKRGMEEEKIRCVMELEREEEGIVNGLMGRLEDVRREKRMLEERVYSSGGNDNELEVLMNLMNQQEQQQQQEKQVQLQQRDVSSLVGPFDRLGLEETQDTTATARSGSSNNDESNSSTSCSLPTPSSTPSAIDVFPCLKEDDVVEEEEEEEEEEEDYNDDILGGRYHDAEMEEELEKMLKMKDSKK